MFQVLFVTWYYILIDGLDDFEDIHMLNNENNPSLVTYLLFNKILQYLTMSNNIILLEM